MRVAGDALGDSAKGSWFRLEVSKMSQEMPSMPHLGRRGGIRMGRRMGRSIFQEEGTASAKVLRHQELGILKECKKVAVA